MMKAGYLFMQWEEHNSVFMHEKGFMLYILFVRKPLKKSNTILFLKAKLNIKPYRKCFLYARY